MVKTNVKLERWQKDCVPKPKKKLTFWQKTLEGVPEAGWILVDFGDLVVHVFGPEQRHYYDLEELWSEAHVVLRMQ